MRYFGDLCFLRDFLDDITVAILLRIKSSIGFGGALPMYWECRINHSDTRLHRSSTVNSAKPSSLSSSSASFSLFSTLIISSRSRECSVCLPIFIITATTPACSRFYTSTNLSSGAFDISSSSVYPSILQQNIVPTEHQQITSGSILEQI